VDGIKCGVSVQQVASCVCISALYGCEWTELNVKCAAGGVCVCISEMCGCE